MAIAATKDCGGAVFFPEGVYYLADTVEVPSNTMLQGGGARSGQYQTGHSAQINACDEAHWTLPYGPCSAPSGGPAFLVKDAFGVRLQNLRIFAAYSGVIVTNAALVRLDNVAVRAALSGPGAADRVNTSRAGCDGCNLVLGSRNAALVIENSFWLWMEDSSFFFYPAINGAGQPTSEHAPFPERGQRPSVILRGSSTDTPGKCTTVICTVYLVHFARVVLSGGVQYQQVDTCDAGGYPGFFDFMYVSSEQTAAPLLDVQMGPAANTCLRMQSVTVVDYRPDDASPPNYLNSGRYPALVPPGTQSAAAGGNGLVPIVALNCSGARAPRHP